MRRPPIKDIVKDVVGFVTPYNRAHAKALLERLDNYIYWIEAENAELRDACKASLELGKASDGGFGVSDLSI